MSTARWFIDLAILAAVLQLVYIAITWARPVPPFGVLTFTIGTLGFLVCVRSELGER